MHLRAVREPVRALVRQLREAGSLPYRLAAGYLNGLVGAAGPACRGRSSWTRRTSPPAGEVPGESCAPGRGTASPCASTAPSAVIRLAQALGGDRPLEGITVLLGFEPLTRRRREVIEAAGARVAMTYGFSEGGTLGQQCRQPVEPGRRSRRPGRVRGHPRQTARPRITSPGAPLLLTSLLPTTPKLLLNACIGDSGVLASRRCGCLFDGLGFTQHLHSIRSTHKITGEGVTFLAADLVHVLEEALPRRFGGGPTDYQLVEQEGAGRAGPVSPAGEPRARSDGRGVGEGGSCSRSSSRRRRPYPFMVEQWKAVDVTVVRAEAVLTARGKFSSFRPLRRA